MQKLDGRKVTLNFPNEIGQEDQESNQAAEPNPRLHEMAALLREEQADEESETEDQRGMLVLEADTGDQAEEQPEFRAGAIENPQGDQNASHPDARLEDIHSQQAVQSEVQRGDDHGDAGESDGITAGAEFAGDQPGEQDLETSGDGRQKSQRGQRIAQSG